MINKSDVTKLKTGMEQTKSDNFNLISNYMKSKAIKDYLNTYVDDVITFKLHRNETFILESQDFAFDDLASKIFSSISKSLPTPNYSDNNNVNVRIAIDYRDEYLQFITEEVYASIPKLLIDRGFRRINIHPNQINDSIGIRPHIDTSAMFTDKNGTYYVFTMPDVAQKYQQDQHKANQFMKITAIMLFSFPIFIVLGIMHIYTSVMIWASSLLLVCAAFTEYKYAAYLYSVNNVIRKL